MTDLDNPVIEIRDIFHQLSVIECRVSTETGIFVLLQMFWTGLSVWEGHGIRCCSGLVLRPKDC